MFIYLFIFIASTLLIYASEKTSSKQKATVFGLIAVLLVSIVAGLRHYTIGTDIEVYVLPVFQIAKSYPYGLKEFLSINFNEIEASFLALEYVGAKIFGTPSFVLFILSFLTNLFIFLGIKNFKSCPQWLQWFTYCFLYYNISLNMMRQMLAMAVIFYLFSKIEKLNFKNIVVLLLLAYLFHRSSSVAIAMVLLYYLMKSKYGLTTVVQVVVMIVPFIVNAIFEFILRLGLISSDKYSVYLTLGEGVGVDWYKVALVGFVLSIYIFYGLYTKDFSLGLSKFWRTMLFLIFVLLFTNSNYLTQRVSAYFSLFEIVLLPSLTVLVSSKHYGKQLITVVYMLALVVYWYTFFIYFGYHETYPFQFGF